MRYFAIGVVYVLLATTPASAQKLIISGTVGIYNPERSIFESMLQQPGITTNATSLGAKPLYGGFIALEATQKINFRIDAFFWRDIFRWQFSSDTLRNSSRAELLLTPYLVGLQLFFNQYDDRWRPYVGFGAGISRVVYERQVTLSLHGETSTLGERSTGRAVLLRIYAGARYAINDMLDVYTEAAYISGTYETNQVDLLPQRLGVEDIGLSGLSAALGLEFKIRVY